MKRAKYSKNFIIKLTAFEKKILKHVKVANWRDEAAMCRKFGYEERKAGIVRPQNQYDWYQGIHAPTSDALFKLVQLELIDWFHSKKTIRTWGDDNGHISLKYRFKK